MNDLEAFVKPFVERLDKAVINLADYLVKQRNNQISMEEALKQAKAIIYKDSDEK